MKKKVLIVSHFKEIGGAECALLGLLNGFDYNEYEVSLFLFRQEEELFPLIPKEVHFLPMLEQYATLARPIFGVLREGHFYLHFREYLENSWQKYMIRSIIMAWAVKWQ